jgi:hypothetical protein
MRAIPDSFHYLAFATGNARLLTGGTAAIAWKEGQHL